MGNVPAGKRYEPSAPERRMLRTLLSCYGKITIKSHHDVNLGGDFDIEVSFARDGTRCSGSSWHPHTVMTALAALRDWVDRLDRARDIVVKARRQVVRELDRAERACEGLAPCSKCKGKGGEMVGYDWVDCSRCNGRGLLLHGKAL